MSMSAAEKKSVIEAYQRAPGDTGSPEVQVALMTSRITQLNRALQRTQTGSPLPSRSGASR